MIRDRLPEELEWYHWHAWAALLEAMIAGPLWYYVYVDGWSSDVVVGQLVGTAESLPGALGLVTLSIGLLGPVAFTLLGIHELLGRGEGEDWWLPLLTLLGIQFWPVQFVAAWYHRRAYHRAPDPSDTKWKFGVSEL